MEDRAKSGRLGLYNSAALKERLHGVGVGKDVEFDSCSEHSVCR